jgi:hypothetical protein
MTKQTTNSVAQLDRLSLVAQREKALLRYDLFGTLALVAGIVAAIAAAF